ncbi:MAG: hypothetical protein RLZZ161_596 [Bacteroidota bacterium]
MRPVQEICSLRWNSSSKQKKLIQKKGRLQTAFFYCDDDLGKDCYADACVLI